MYRLGVRRLALLLLLVGLLGCSAPKSPPPRTPETTPSDVEPDPVAPSTDGSQSGPSRPDEVGLASWYGNAFAGRLTSSGERFDPKLFTAAHKKLPFGTWVEVRRIDTGRTVRVRINDRGPNGRAANRIIDLSRRAAEEIDIVRAGVVRVELRVVSGP